MIIMKTHPDDHGIMEHTCRALRYIGLFGSESKTAVAEAGGIEVRFAAHDTHQGSIVSDYQHI